LSEILLKIWYSLIEERLKLNQNELTLKLINLVFCDLFLNYSLINQNISSILNKIALSIIKHSFSRRSLLPNLYKRLLKYQIKYPSSFSNNIRLFPNLLINGYLFDQINSNNFKLEKIVAEVFDRKHDKIENELYYSIYGENEISSKIYLMIIVSSIKANMNKEVIKFNDLKEVKKRLKLYEMLLILIGLNCNEKLIRYVDEFFLIYLEKEMSPLVRSYVEWIISKILINDYNLSDKINEEKKLILKYFRDFKTRENEISLTILISFLKIFYLIANQLNEGFFRQYFLHKEFLPLLLGNCISNKTIIRHFSNELVYFLYEKSGINEITNSEIIGKIYSKLIKDENFQKYSQIDGILWDINKDFNFIGICGEVLLKNFKETNIDYINEKNFEKYCCKDLLKNSYIGIGKFDFDFDLKNKIKTNIQFGENSNELQTKSGNWGLINIEDEKKAVKRSELIVVGSLVDKAPNLGGICRLCEVMGVKYLTINDIKMLKDKEFKRVSVTSEEWLDIIEVKEKEIRKYILNKKHQEGYTLIGLEQTDNSFELNSQLKFPKKSLILIGKEREGIPGELLCELDFCVEIKQTGIIRSMNIQTATAIVVNAYSMEHCY
ncbi:tRNA (guanosine(18)-2'-O)-methyltransferase ASCRUDRAFT_40104, partial [Ascoidea rubescens DSM 1968]